MGKSGSNSKIMLIVPVLIIVLAFVAYKYLVTPMQQQKKELSDQQYELKARKIELQNLKTHEEEFKTTIESARTQINTALNKFAGGQKPEKSIIFADTIEKRYTTETEKVTFSSLSFSEGHTVTTMNLPLIHDEENGMYSVTYSDITLYSSPLIFSYECGYTQLKDVMTYVSEYPERMNLQAINASYNPDSGMLSGGFTLNLYYVEGGEKEYVAPEIYDINLGVDNIFTE